MLLIRIPSHSSVVFLVEATEQSGFTKKFILKTRRLKKNNILYREAIVAELLEEFGCPQPVLYGQSLLNEIAFYPFVEGVRLDQILADKHVLNAFRSMRAIQRTLEKSDSPFLPQADRQVEIDYAGKLCRRIRRNLGISVGEDTFSMLSAKLNHLAEFRTYVTDRSPANWFVTSEGLIPFDFDLVKYDVPLLDWVLFVDDYRLRTNNSRLEVIEMACSVDSRFSVNDFHRASMYQNILQGCYLVEDRRASQFVLKRALTSAEALREGAIQELLQELIGI